MVLVGVLGSIRIYSPYRKDLKVGEFRNSTNLSSGKGTTARAFTTARSAELLVVKILLIYNKAHRVSAISQVHNATEEVCIPLVSSLPV